MSAKSLFSVLALLAAASVALPPVPALARQAIADTDARFSTEELDQILAPIALYPDDLLSDVLMASTYPDEVVRAARWIEAPENADLQGAALTRALADKDWDPSVKALTQFPDVLVMMSEQIDWMQKLGEAFIASEADVMDRIQFLRAKAEEAGNLKSNTHQTVTTREVDGDDFIYIEPADPEIIYVPLYDPYDVYGSWWYPDYPPYYWEPDDVVYVDYFYWGAGIAIAPTLWAWSRPRWHDRYIHIDRRKYNRLARHKWKGKSDRWRHDARHRRGVKFKGAKAWRKTWHPKHTIEKARRTHIRHRHRDGRRVLKRDGRRHPDLRQHPEPQLKVEEKERLDALAPKLRIRKPGDRPPAFKPKPDTRTLSGAEKRTGPKVKKHHPNAKQSFGGSKKHKAVRIEKHPSADQKPQPEKAFSKPRKRSFSGKPSHMPKTTRAHPSGAHKGGGGQHKGGGNKGGGKTGDGKKKVKDKH